MASTMKKSLFSLCVFSLPLVAHAANWTSTTNGNWNDPANWDTANFPDSFAKTANFNINSGNLQITLGENIKIGTVNFNKKRYTIKGNTLVLKNSTVGGASHGIITSKIRLAGDAIFTPYSSKVIELRGKITGPGDLIVNAQYDSGVVDSENAATGNGKNDYTGKTIIKRGIFRYNRDVIPQNNDVIVGGGAGKARFLHRWHMSDNDAFNLELLSDGCFEQNNGRRVVLRDLKGSGEIKLHIPNNNDDRFVVIGDNSGLLSSTFSGKISGGAAEVGNLDHADGSFFKVRRNRELVLEGASTFDCRCYVNDNSQIIVKHNNALGSTSREAFTFDNGSYILSGNGLSISKAFSLNGPGRNSGGSLFNDASGNNEITGDVQIGWAGGGEVAIPASIQVAPGTTLSLKGVVKGDQKLTKIGDGILDFIGSKPNTLSGNIDITAGGLHLSQTSGPSVAGHLNIPGGTCQMNANNQMAATSHVNLCGGSVDVQTFTSKFERLNFLSGAFTGSGVTTLENLAGNVLNIRNNTLNAPIAISGATGGSVDFDVTNGGTAVLQNVACGAAVRDFNIPKGPEMVDMRIFNSSGVGINKKGGGYLEFATPGAHAFTGMTTIEEGTVSLKSIFTGDMTVKTGALLKGTGSVHGTLNVEGSVSPGNSIGIMDVQGDVNFAPGSIYPVEFSATTADLLNVTNGGKVTIQPGAILTLTPVDDKQLYPTGQEIDKVVISAEGGVTGLFNELPNPMPGHELFSQEIQYKDNTVHVVVTNNGFGSVGPLFENRNVRRIGNCLDDLQLDPGSDLAGIISLIQTSSFEKIHEALDQMQPSIIGSMGLVQEENGIRMRKTVQRRIKEASRSDCDIVLGEKNGVAVWTEAGGDSHAQRGDKHHVGFRARTFDVRGGVDISNGENLLFGVAGGYSNSKVNWKKGGGDGSIESSYANVYLGAFTNHLFINIISEGSYSRYRQDRNIKFDKINRTAKGKSGGFQLLEHADAGFAYNFGIFEFRPFGSIDFIYSKRNEFDESGADSINLRIGNQHHSSLRYEGGAELSILCNKAWRDLSVDLKLGYGREKRLSRTDFRFCLLENLGCGGEVLRYAPEHSFVVPEFGVTIHLSERSYLKLGYNGEIGSGYHNHAGFGHFGCTF